MTETNKKTPANLTELDEMRAKAVHACYDTTPWENMTPLYRAHRIDAMKFVREADERAGLMTVPMEITNAMLEPWPVLEGDWQGGMTVKKAWGLIIAASPFAKKDSDHG